MSEKKFRNVIIAVLTAGVICTGILTAYTVYKHNHCSLITYISNER